MSRTARPMTRAEFEKLRAKDDYFKGRWNYMKYAIAFAERQPPGRVLELGARSGALYRGSGADTMDRRRYGVWRPTVKHDATVTPWPVKDKAYDLFVALQVWEHLGTAQARAFKEVQRVAKTAVLSFPFMWMHKPKTDCHYGISRAKIMTWVGGLEPVAEHLVNQGIFKRLVMYWEFQ